LTVPVPQSGVPSTWLRSAPSGTGNGGPARDVSETLGERPVASFDVSAPSPPPDAFYHEDVPPEARAATAAALRDAFERLQPQGSDPWNFLAAFTHLGDRYGPYQPGASDLSRLLEGSDEEAPDRAGPLARRRRRRAGAAAAEVGEQSELAFAMAQVVEALRFTAARVRTLEERLARQDRPVDGAAWLVPARELGTWVEPVTAHLLAALGDGERVEILHGDCGEGDLVRALNRSGVPASGAEPRGMVALSGLESGCAIAINEVSDELAARPPASLGGLVLSGVVDRLPLPALVALLAQARRVLTRHAHLVVVATEPEVAEARCGVVARDLLQAAPQHVASWEVLLDRAGFVGYARLGDPESGDDDHRFALAATVPG
jgi:hypothetical protein